MSSRPLPTDADPQAQGEEPKWLSHIKGNQQILHLCSEIWKHGRAQGFIRALPAEHRAKFTEASMTTTDTLPLLISASSVQTLYQAVMAVQVLGRNVGLALWSAGQQREAKFGGGVSWTLTRMSEAIVKEGQPDDLVKVLTDCLELQKLVGSVGDLHGRLYHASVKALGEERTGTSMVSMQSMNDTQRSLDEFSLLEQSFAKKSALALQVVDGQSGCDQATVGYINRDSSHGVKEDPASYVRPEHLSFFSVTDPTLEKDLTGYLDALRAEAKRVFAFDFSAAERAKTLAKPESPKMQGSRESKLSELQLDLKLSESDKAGSIGTSRSHLGGKESEVKSMSEQLDRMRSIQSSVPNQMETLEAQLKKWESSAASSKADV